MQLSPFGKAVGRVKANALAHRLNTRRPSFHMLAEELLELSLALRGQHEHSPEHELAQIGGMAINWLADLMIRADEPLTAGKAMEELFDL